MSVAARMEAPLGLLSALLIGTGGASRNLSRTAIFLGNTGIVPGCER
jgi:hypothetical protein